MSREAEPPRTSIARPRSVALYWKTLRSRRATDFLILVVALPLWALWSAARSRPVFVIRIAAGVPRVSRATSPGSFCRKSREVCSRHGVRQGVVRGVEERDRIRSTFSDGMPEPCRQQLRNLWSSRAGRQPGRHHP